MKIHIFGASGSGVTTLGQALSKELRVPYFDTDDYYWKKTDPPFMEKVNIPDRQANMLRDTSPHSSWVIGGSLISWGDFIKDSFDMVVFLHVPQEIRIDRLKEREYQRYGEVIFKDPNRNQQYREFMDWVAKYENDDFEGRSRKNHLSWLEGLDCYRLKIEGDTKVSERVGRCMDAIAKIS